MNLVVDERIGGRTNHSPLTPLGEQQARALGAHVRAALAHANVPPGKCLFFSSPAVRAVDTARHVMTALEVRRRTQPCWSGCCAVACTCSRCEAGFGRLATLLQTSDMSARHGCRWSTARWCKTAGSWSLTKGSGRGEQGVERMPPLGSVVRGGGALISASR